MKGLMFEVIKTAVCLFVVLVFVVMILGWMSETDYWLRVAEAFKNL